MSKSHSSAASAAANDSLIVTRHEQIEKLEIELANVEKANLVPEI